MIKSVRSFQRDDEMIKVREFKINWSYFLIIVGCLISLFLFTFPQSVSAKQANAYDISQYQGRLHNSQVRGLKHEVNFMIVRAQSGDYPDTEAHHTEHLMQRNHIPYGAYSYSYYTSPTNAQIEAKELYQRAPKANFYVNDIEQNDAGNTFNLSTRDWANEIHHLTSRPAVLYSGEYFMNNYIRQKTRNKYNAIWLAAYGSEPAPNYHYDLWQSSDNHYSNALGQRVDADVFPEGYNKPMSFWTHRKHHYRNPNDVIKPSGTNNVNQNPSQNQQNPVNPNITNINNGHITKINSKQKHLERQSKHLTTKLNKLISSDKHIHSISVINIEKRMMHHFKRQLHHLLHVQQTKFINNNPLHTHLLSVQRTMSLQTYYLRVLETHILKHKTNSNNYYHSRHIHHLVVTRHKIALYAFGTHNIIGYAYRNYTIHHVHFRKAHWHHHIIYRAISHAKGIKFNFTCNKHCVRP